MIKEVKIQVVREIATEYSPMLHPRNIVEFFRNEVVKSSWFDAEKECLVVFSLDVKLGIKNFNLVSLGLANQTLCHSREVYRLAILSAASHIVIIHNHPSGDPTPSADDIRMTRQMVQAGEVLGIPLLDHVVIGALEAGTEKGYVSMKEQGLMN